MNFLPFSQLAQGALFRCADSDTVWMKSAEGNRAMAMQSYWATQHRLVKRGALLAMSSSECVIPLPEDFTMSAERVDPVDPKRRFWAPGERINSIGRRAGSYVNIFGGLFMYSGCGAGNYYSLTEGEIISCSPSEARKLANAEGAVFVYHDIDDRTDDPDLKDKRRQAEAAKVAQLKASAKAAAVTPPWSSEEQAQAEAEGWGIFNDAEIQRIDEAEVFDGDESAIAYVMNRASTGSVLHQRALAIHSAT